MTEMYEVSHLVREHQVYMSGLEHELQAGERQLRKETKMMDEALRRGLRRYGRDEDRPSVGSKIKAALHFLLR